MTNLVPKKKIKCLLHDLFQIKHLIKEDDPTEGKRERGKERDCKSQGGNILKRTERGK